jgi:hypothetical protein
MTGWDPGTREPFAMPQDPDQEIRTRIRRADLELTACRNLGRAKVTTGDLSRQFSRRANDAQQQLNNLRDHDDE